MDGFINSKIEKQTIYEIYRACRLCGAGAGYKMPIIQNVLDLDGAEVELKQKIRECVQIEVHQDDKMPPLICELCVDKVNDFYEFLEMCRHTNKRTRLRLGLPPQAMPRGAPDAGDCILGVTEPVYLNDSSSEHSLRSKGKSNKNEKNKRSESKNITSNNTPRSDTRDIKKEPRSLRSKQPSPPRLRGMKRYNNDDDSLSKIQTLKKSSEPVPKSILKNRRDIKTEVEPSLSSRLKRQRDKEVPVKKELQNKKVKLLVKPLPQRTTRTSPNNKQKSEPASHRCKTCRADFDNYRSLNNHMRSHAIRSVDKKPVKNENKVIKCTDCSKTFPRKTLLNIHICPKQGGDCNNCQKHFYSQKSLIRHRSTCVQKKKEVIISPKIQRILKPFQVKIARCDPLLENMFRGHYDVSEVKYDYGLDKSRVYPYILGGSRVKFEPGYMVNINDDIREAFDADKYVHWDSDDTDTDVEMTEASSKKVDNLTVLALRTIFSQRFIGKVPKKRRKVKAEKAFDSILNVSGFDSDLKRGIDDIIDSLERIDEQVDKDKDKINKSDRDSLFGDENAPTVTNDDFDSLFNNDKSVTNVNDNANKANDIHNIANDNVASEKDSEEKGKNVINNILSESTVSEESSKGKNEIGLSRKLDETVISIDLNEMDKICQESNKKMVENIDDAELKCNILNHKEIVNKIESNCEDGAEITGNLTVTEKLNEDKGLTDKIENKEDTQINNRVSKDVDIIKEPTQIDNESSKESLSEDVVNENEEIPSNYTENVSNNDDAVNANDAQETESGANIDNTETDRVNGGSVTEDKFNIEDLEDLSDAEMDDKRLMAALDAQIGENETEDAKNAVNDKEQNRTLEKDCEGSIDDLAPSSIRSADLESISDDEFNLND